MNDQETKRRKTFGACVRCGHIAAQLEHRPGKGLFVIHDDGFPPCPIDRGDMPVLGPAGS
ncbi:MAG TPA: hypothetical protein VGL46_17690 [Pseudonocardiaceae bacterium]